MKYNTLKCCVATLGAEKIATVQEAAELIAGQTS